MKKLVVRSSANREPERPELFPINRHFEPDPAALTDLVELLFRLLQEPAETGQIIASNTTNGDLLSGQDRARNVS